MSVEERAAELFIDFPTPPTAATGTVCARQSGKLLFVGGAVPFSEGRVQGRGRCGLEVSVDQGRLAARSATIQALAMVRATVGSLDKVRQIVQLTAHVASGAEFHDQAKVADGASQLLTELFGAQGHHARTVVGVNVLPHAACIEISLVIEVK